MQESCVTDSNMLVSKMFADPTRVPNFAFALPPRVLKYGRVGAHAFFVTNVNDNDLYFTTSIMRHRKGYN